MFTNKEMKLLGDGYFTIIRTEERFVEVLSNNTSHQWMIFKKLSAADKPVTLYHKHQQTSVLGIRFVFLRKKLMMVEVSEHTMMSMMSLK